MRGRESEYIFCYKTTVRFSSPIYRHHILLRCLPTENDCQKILEQHLILPSWMHIQHNNDCFGNKIQYGGTEEAHESMAYIATGRVRCNRYLIPDPTPLFLYSIPSRLTQPSQEIREMIPERGKPISMAEEICRSVYEKISYTPLSTTVYTPASVVVYTGEGVCQDMAHVMISICRLCGIPARYVNGFVTGTGKTHAWVEVWHDGAWIPFDPTHNISPETGYIKIAHGRDANDCPVCRGTYIGCVTEDMEIDVFVEKQ